MSNDTQIAAHMRLLNEYVEACNAGNSKNHLKAADAARQKVEASALSLISTNARSEPDCAGGMPCTDCPNKRDCQAGCIRQGEALERPNQNDTTQRHPLDVEALYELQKVMADFGGDWPDVPGEQEVVRRAKMLSRLWKSEQAALAAQPNEPVFHLRSFGDVSAKQLDDYCLLFEIGRLAVAIKRAPKYQKEQP